jgi:hypothetical protein
MVLKAIPGIAVGRYGIDGNMNRSMKITAKRYWT